MRKCVKSLYVSTSGDTTLEVPIPLDVEGCPMWNS